MPKLSSELRVDRARKRAKKEKVPVAGHQKTPFGHGTLTDKRRGRGMFATTRAKDFKGSTALSKTDGSYQQILPRLTPATIKAVIASMRSETRARRKKKIVAPDNTSVKDPDQRRLAAHLSMIARSEQQRDAAAPKAMRGGLRAAAKKAPTKRLDAFEHAFPQGAPASKATKLDFATGAKALQSSGAPGSKGLSRSQKARRQAAEAMSDSSDDGEK